MSTDAAPVNRVAAAAVALRVSGASYSDITEALGLSGPDEAKDLVERDLAARAKDIDPSEREKQRALAVARLERLMRSVARKAMDDNDPEHIPAVKTFMGLIDREAKLLGLDAPVEVAVYNPTAIEIEQWVQSMVARHQTAEYAVIEAQVIAGELEAGDGDAA